MMRKKHDTKEEEALHRNRMDAQCSRIYINRLKDILILSHRVLIAQSNNLGLIVVNFDLLSK